MFEEETDEHEGSDEIIEPCPSTMEKQLDIIGAGSILNDMAILTEDDFYTNYIRCETDVQVGIGN